MKLSTPSGRHPLVLVIGFGPFPGMRRNPSAELARLVAASARWRLLGAEARAVVLATSYAGLERELEPALAGPPAPDAVLMLGVASRSRHVRVEGRATSRASPLLPDQGGRTPPTCAPRGPSIRRSTVSTAVVTALLRRNGVAARRSGDAGRYLCNAGYYRSLGQPRPTLFLHVPKPPRPCRRRDPAKPSGHVGWRERLAQAFVAVAIEILAQQRRVRGTATLRLQVRPAADKRGATARAVAGRS